MKNKLDLIRKKILIALCLGIASLNFSLQAEVHEVKLDPHRWLGSPFWDTYVDLNMDGNIDCALSNYRAGFCCYLNPSTMIVENKDLLNHEDRKSVV